MKNTAHNHLGYAVYAIRYNKREKTFRVTTHKSNRTLAKVDNPTDDEINYFVYGIPTAMDVLKTYLS